MLRYLWALQFTMFFFSLRDAFPITIRIVKLHYTYLLSESILFEMLIFFFPVSLILFIFRPYSLILSGKMLGHGDPGVLLDPALPRWLCLQPGLLSRGHGLLGHRRWGRHDPRVEHSLREEQLRREKFLAGCQVQGHSGKGAFFKLVVNFSQVSNSLLENTFSLKWTPLRVTGGSVVFPVKLETRKREGPSLSRPIISKFRI